MTGRYVSLTCRVIFVLVLVTTTDTVHAQQWSGSGTATGNIWRQGYIGMGRTTPLYPLHVSGDIRFDLGEGLHFTKDGNYFGQHADARLIQMMDNNGINGSVDGGIVFERKTVSDSIAYAVMTLRGNGRVGIGPNRTAPAYALDVEGTMSADNIRTNGKVGIGAGVGSPAYPLHVAGDIRFNLGEGLHFTGNSDYFATSKDARIIQMLDGNGINGSVDGGIVFERKTVSDGIAHAVMTLRGNGQVGIGPNRTIPAYALDVEGTVNADEILVGGEPLRGAQWQDVAQGGSTHIHYTEGHVGIGTTSTLNHLLSVAGTIRAKEIIVDSGWADFVFDDSYRLRSLSEVAAFIDRNGHLPDVPSAEAISENGLAASAILTLQMQKIEELTLYLIEKEKQVQELMARVEALEGERGE